MKPVPTKQDIETLHNRFKRVAEIMAWGEGPWKPPSPRAWQALRAAVKEFAEYSAKYCPPK
jgi:hypothetical protein